MLTENQTRALALLNTNEGLLEAVIEQLRLSYFKKWLATSEEHSKQREALHVKAIVLNDVAKIIREATNKTNLD